MERRKFIQGVVAGSAALVSGTAATNLRAAMPVAADSDPGQQPLPEAAPASSGKDEPTQPLACESLQPMLEPIHVGDHIGLGWSLTAMTPVECGAAVLAITHAATNRQVNVHVCRHTGRASGAAHSQTLDFLLMNSGDGATMTDESLGRVLNVLSDIAAHNERSGRRPPKTLQTHDERMSLFRIHEALA